MRTKENKKDSYRTLLIKELKAELEKAKGMDISRIAARIREIGFSCRICGRCCMMEFGDNRVFVTSEEIRTISQNTGLSREEVVDTPLPEEPEPLFQSYDVDVQGNVHTFGWILRRKECGNCRFIQDNRCSIYQSRPMLCRTYPFYIVEGELQVSECEGLGANISQPESLAMAQDLVKRYISEVKETISLYENYEDFIPDSGGFDIAKKRAEEGKIVCIVHDGLGSHMMVKNIQE